MTLVFDPVKALDHAVTLGAAFAGATAAFFLERYRISRDEKSKSRAALNRALYTIYNLWNVQEQLRKDVVADWKGKPDAWFNMPATPPIKSGIAAFDASGLDVLLTEDPALYAQLLLEEQRFASTIHLVEERSRVILEEAWPRMAAAGYALGSQVPLPDLSRALGYDIVRRLTVYSESIISQVPENLSSLRATHDSLRHVAKRLFPKQKFLLVKFDEKPDSPTAT